MNTANKLTILRVLLVPVFLVFLYLKIPLNYLWALLVFIAASVTDLLDGKIARKQNTITNFGKFLDPLADKILVIAAMIAFIGMGLAHPIAVILVIVREFVVSGIRLIAVSGKGKVIDANWWGKVKTTLQLIVIITVLTFLEFGRIIESEAVINITNVGSNIGMWVVGVFTALSGVKYVTENKDIFKDIT